MLRLGLGLGLNRASGAVIEYLIKQWGYYTVNGTDPTTWDEFNATAWQDLES